MDISDDEQPRLARKKGRQLAFMDAEMNEGEKGEKLDVEPTRKDGLDEELPTRKDPTPDAEMQEDRVIEEMRKKKKKKTKKGKGKEVRVEDVSVQGRDDAIEGIGMPEERETSAQDQLRLDDEGNELQVVEGGCQQEDDVADNAVMEEDKEANKQRKKKKTGKRKEVLTVE